jgi:hypothetical protein
MVAPAHPVQTTPFVGQGDMHRSSVVDPMQMYPWLKKHRSESGIPWELLFMVSTSLFSMVRVHRPHTDLLLAFGVLPSTRAISASNTNAAWGGHYMFFEW